MTKAVPGRRWFLAGCVGILLFGGVHLLAVYHANFREPDSPKQAEIKQALVAESAIMGPFKPSGWGMVQILNSSYSVLLLYVGVLNLAVLKAAVAHGRMKMLTVVNLIFSSMLLAVTIIFQFPPPMVFAGAICAMFFLSLSLQATSGKGKG